MSQNIIHTVPLIGRKAGGLASAVGGLLNELNALVERDGSDFTARLYSFSPDEDDSPTVNPASAWFHPLTPDLITPMGFSRNMRSALDAEARLSANLFHTHGMWQHTNHLTCRVARRNHIPYILSPHGMLFPQALRTGAIRKKLSLRLWFDRDFKGAAALHATSDLELKYLRELGYRGAVAVVPNVVQAPPKNFLREEEFRCKRHTDGLTIGYLGRLHPRKQLENILRAMALVRNLDTRLIVIGGGDAGYEEFLKKEALRLGLAGKVEFRGFQSDDGKWNALQECNLTILPSDMENFGMVVAESLLAGIPVFATADSPWEKIERLGFGWHREPSPENIASVLAEIGISSDLLEPMGKQGREWAKKQFNGAEIAAKMYQLYDWALGNTAQIPPFVDK